MAKDTCDTLKNELGAMLNQVSHNTNEIDYAAQAEEKNIDIIKSNLNEAMLELIELSADAAEQSRHGDESYSGIDERLDKVQEAAVQSMCQAQKANKQKPMFSSLGKMFQLMILFLEQIETDIIEPLHVLALNSAIQANRPHTEVKQLSVILKTVATFTNELTETSKVKIAEMVRNLKPYIETAKKLEITNDEFFSSAQNASARMGQAFDYVEEIKESISSMVEMTKLFKERIERVTINLSNIESHINEFSGSVSHTANAIGEIKKSIIEVSSEFNKINAA